VCAFVIHFEFVTIDNQINPITRQRAGGTMLKRCQWHQDHMSPEGLKKLLCDGEMHHIGLLDRPLASGKGKSALKMVNPMGTQKAHGKMSLSLQVIVSKKLVLNYRISGKGSGDLPLDLST
jgi:hypothetical protein